MASHLELSGRKVEARISTHVPLEARSSNRHVEASENYPRLNDQETHSIFTQFHLSLLLCSSNDLKENYILMFLLASTVNPNHTGNSMLLIMKVTLKVPMP